VGLPHEIDGQHHREKNDCADQNPNMIALRLVRQAPLVPQFGDVL
jgi:hypothetical protein